MLDKTITKISGYIAARVTEEILRRSPEIIDQVLTTTLKSLPDLYDDIAERVIQRLLSRIPLPLPFKR